MLNSGEALVNPFLGTLLAFYSTGNMSCQVSISRNSRKELIHIRLPIQLLLNPQDFLSGVCK